MILQLKTRRRKGEIDGQLFFKKVLKRNPANGAMVSPRDCTKTKGFSDRQKELLQIDSDTTSQEQSKRRKKKKKEKKRNRSRHDFERNQVSDAASGSNQNGNFWGLSMTTVSGDDEIDDGFHGYHIARNRLSRGATNHIQDRWQNFNRTMNDRSRSNENDDLAYAIELSAMEAVNSGELHRHQGLRDMQQVNRRRPGRIVAPVLHAPRNTGSNESPESTRRSRGSVLV